MEALDRRDLGALFAATHRAGLSFNKIAEACGMKAERVSLVARGLATVTTLESIERIADGLRIPGALLGLAERPWEHPASTTSEHRNGPDDLADDPVNRRQLLRGALAAGLTGTALTALTAAREGLDLALTGSPSPAADLAHWSAAVEHYSYGYGGSAPAHRLAQLVTDVADLRTLLQRPHPVAARTELCRAAGQLAGMVAVCLHDLGEAREARRWFSSAGAAAAEAGDRALHAWVLAREAMTPLTYGAPLAAADLAARARNIAGDRPSASAALAAAVEARASAMVGDRQRALTALADVQRLAERLGPTDTADTWFGLPAQKRLVHLSHAYTLLGDTTQAREAQHQALVLTGPSSHQTQALLKLDGAICLQRDGDTVGACKAATEVLAALPADQRTGLTRSRALELYRTVLPQHRGLSVVRDLEDLTA
ncbi:hypothetical protein [Kitasatospora griseola]|uniref:hypothetical protein n=1 Tax=Kitasatospora griseola TaxID=2064 RepID=UPI0036658CE9